MDFNVGDVVKLKSYGPDMTVVGFGDSLDGHSLVECCWFKSNVSLEQKHFFPPEALEKVKDPIDPVTEMLEKFRKARAKEGGRGGVLGEMGTAFVWGRK